MSVEYMDSFDDDLAVIAGLAAKWDSINGLPVISAVNPRTGPNSLRCPSPTQDAVRRTVRRIPFTNEWIVGGAINLDGIGPNLSQGVIAIGEQALTGGSNQAHVTMESNDSGQLEAYTPGNTLAGTSVGSPIIAGVWHYWEMRGLVSDTIGEAEFRIDGVTVLSLSGIDTRNGGAGIVTEYKIGLEDELGYVDDVYVLDTATGIAPRNTFLGDVEIIALFPDADDQVAWAPTPAAPATNFDKVDETPPSLVDFVSTQTPNDIDLYSHQPVPFVGGVVAVQASFYGDKDATGTRIVRIRTESPAGGAGTPAESGPFGLPVSPIVQSFVHQQDPNGPIDWTDVSVNAASFGQRLES